LVLKGEKQSSEVSMASNSHRESGSCSRANPQECEERRRVGSSLEAVEKQKYMLQRPGFDWKSLLIYNFSERSAGDTSGLTRVDAIEKQKTEWKSKRKKTEMKKKNQQGRWMMIVLR
jgi:hypothetical protein